MTARLAAHKKRGRNLALTAGSFSLQFMKQFKNRLFAVFGGAREIYLSPPAHVFR
jgi:hypothetical protein